MDKRLLKSSFAVLFFMVITTASVAADFSIGVESRSFYSRWYEYPGTYYEEDFSLIGVRGEVLIPIIKAGNMNVGYGFSGSLYPIGSYRNSPGDSNSAYGVRAGAMIQMDIPLGRVVNLLARAEGAYLGAFGDSDNGSHEEAFGVYLPSIDGGVGLRFNGVSVGPINGVSIMYTFSLAELGIDTDNWVQGTPSSEDWSNSSLMVMLDMRY